ncbi:MAG: hypothetical protein PHV34_18990 [Verrucomicrobiae bacterium]|nr:hypothetical protein [Verrucomicrobiae bacterium]
MNPPSGKSNRTPSRAEQPPASAPDSSEIRSLWGIIVTLAFIGFFFSLNLGFFLLKQNQMISTQLQQLREQETRASQIKQSFQEIIQDTANLSVQIPELRALAAKYGITVVVPTPPPPQPEAPPPSHIQSGAPAPNR